MSAVTLRCMDAVPLSTSGLWAGQRGSVAATYRASYRADRNTSSRNAVTFFIELYCVAFVCSLQAPTFELYRIIKSLQLPIKMERIFLVKGGAVLIWDDLKKTKTNKIEKKKAKQKQNMCYFIFGIKNTKIPNSLPASGLVPQDPQERAQCKSPALVWVQQYFQQNIQKV